MTQYALRRLFLVIPTLFGVTMVVFMAVRFLPGDVVDQLSGEYGAASPEFRAQLVKQYSLDKNMPQQYALWMGKLARGDMGISIISARSVRGEISQRLPTTFLLGLMAIFVQLVIAIPVGMTAALKQDSTIDYVARSLSIGLLAVPGFWMALLAITYGYILFGWTPPLRYHPFWEEPLTALKSLWVPALILGGFISAVVMRLLRSTMLEVLRQDYIRTARAKGLDERAVVWRHAARNAAIPVVTIIGLEIPNLIGGTVIMESIFSIPGMGSYLFSSIQIRDYPVVQGVVLLSALVVILSNLVVDLSYSIIDPRIRFHGR
ncbi:MAG: ABC transporter permease [Dehalococcoidia bacterium]|nr:ABC transporter permease [Dehalococcoidia bacterium]